MIRGDIMNGALSDLLMTPLSLAEDNINLLRPVIYGNSEEEEDLYIKERTGEIDSGRTGNWPPGTSSWPLTTPQGTSSAGVLLGVDDLIWVSCRGLSVLWRIW